MASSVETTRRTTGIRSNERTEQLIAAVLAATVEELAKSGYDGFRVDSVAAAAGINKTSVYRRWPTKLDLIAAAMRERTRDIVLPDTGSLRGDFKALVALLVDRYAGPYVRSLMLIAVGARADAEFTTLMGELRGESLRYYGQIVDKAVARGELPEGTDGALLMEVLLSPIGNRVLKLHQPVTPAFVDQLIELVLRGAERR